MDHDNFQKTPDPGDGRIMGRMHDTGMIGSPTGRYTPSQRSPNLPNQRNRAKLICQLGNTSMRYHDPLLFGATGNEKLS